tara:strand:- start:276 stop:569 length:294 start_codon:yes stop_codon:yes gene_type:complete
MPVIIAQIKAKKNSIEIVKNALVEIAQYVEKNEKGTSDYFVTQDNNEKHIFFTYERFLTMKDIKIHNSSDALKDFIKTTDGHLEEEISISTGKNIDY